MPASVITIGSFDGVHLGHQRLITQLLEHSRAQQLPAVVITFNELPYQTTAGKAVAQLMSWREKTETLLQLGVQIVVSLNFDQRLREITAEAFISDILINSLGMKTLIIGDDFHFGRNREGDHKLLVQQSKLHNYQVLDTQTLSMDADRISSTRIRQLLNTGDLPNANKLLGRAYSMSGRVIAGKKLGRELGFPTANIAIDKKVSPLAGVFLVAAQVDDAHYWGVANVGVRPAVNTLEKPLLEVYLFDFSGNLYGKKMVVRFHLRLREERDFENIAQLKIAINEDVQTALQLIENLRNL